MKQQTKRFGVVALLAGATLWAALANSATVTLMDPFPCWQLQYFGCTNCPQADAAADPDGDGQNNPAFLPDQIAALRAATIATVIHTRVGQEGMRCSASTAPA